MARLRTAAGCPPSRGAAGILGTQGSCPQPCSPAAQAALYVCRFMDKSGWGYASDALRCLNWCLTKGASISGAAEAVRQVWVPLNALCPIIWQSAVAARPRSLPAQLLNRHLGNWLNRRLPPAHLPPGSCSQLVGRQLGQAGHRGLVGR